MKFVSLSLVGLFLGMSVAYADDAIPPAYRTDPSKPVPLAQISPAQADTAPVSPGTNKAWKTYDSPLRECVKGDTIMPSSGHDLFSFMFHNNAQIDITMSIQGWQKKQCLVNFSEATIVQYCHFNDNELKDLLKAILLSDQFDPTASFAQVLSSNCSPMAPASKNG